MKIERSNVSDLLYNSGGQKALKEKSALTYTPLKYENKIEFQSVFPYDGRVIVTQATATNRPLDYSDIIWLCRK